MATDLETSEASEASSLENALVEKFNLPPSYSTPYRKAKERMAFTGSFGDKSWWRNSII